MSEDQCCAIMAAVLAAGAAPPADPVAAALALQRATWEAVCARRLADRKAGEPGA